MEPLYERLLKRPFSDSVSAIEYCRSVCAEFGFTVKQEASANRVNINIQCTAPLVCKLKKVNYIEHLCLLLKGRLARLAAQS